MFFFFFQAEDGIRDLTVTGVQTCALPISEPVHPAPIVPPAGVSRVWRALGLVLVGALLALGARNVLPVSQTIFASLQGETKGRSEERRVGKEGRSRWWPYH